MLKMWRNIIAWMKLSALYVAHLMKAGDDAIMDATSDSLDGGVRKETKKLNEQHKVCQDLLRGEITEEVMELRHEMYFAERESKKYAYSGGGRATKKNLFSYNGNIENSDGLKVLLVQENKEDVGGIFSDLDPNKVRDFTFKVEREFTPTSKIEEYCQKIVVCADGEKCRLDFYFDNYVRQFDRRHRIFINELGRILDGDRRSEIIDFSSLSFVTKDAYGSDDHVSFRYSDFIFCQAFTYDGSVVLRFTCQGGKKEDLLDEIYHEETARKIAENAPRKNNDSTISFESAIGDGYDNEAATELIKEEMGDD